MKFPFLTGSELMMGNVSWCNASRDNVSGRDELNFAWDPWEAQWGVSSSQPNPLNDTVAFQFSVSWLSKKNDGGLLEWFGIGCRNLQGLRILSNFPSKTWASPGCVMMQ